MPTDYLFRYANPPKRSIIICIMDTVNYLVVTFFIATTLMLGYLGFVFRNVKRQPMTHFGNGLLLVGVAFLVWTYIVAAHPANLNLLVAIGVAPLIGSFIMFLLAAMTDIKAKYRPSLFIISGAIIVGLVAARYFLYKSDPGFTQNGFFAFNIDPVVLYFYAILTAFNFIPALYVVGRRITNDILRIGVELGLTLVALGLVIMITSQDENLQIANGIGIAIGLSAATLVTTMYSLTKNTKP